MSCGSTQSGFHDNGSDAAKQGLPKWQNTSTADANPWSVPRVAAADSETPHWPPPEVMDGVYSMV